MKIFNSEISFKLILARTLAIFSISLLITLFAGVYILGLMQGYVAGKKDAQEEYLSYFGKKISQLSPTSQPTSSPSPVLQPTDRAVSKVIWGGPELWRAVNAKRVEYGVNPLQQRDELCTIASIRLNELLDLGKLDNHEGFSNLKERRSDLAWIFEKYSTMAEFLAVGGKTAEETVSLWENTLGHKKLLTGGEYVWGCIYAQNTFAVAITAY